MNSARWSMLTKLFNLFTSALLGYLWGWIWGWSLVDPNLDLWALTAALGALLGLGLGLAGLFESRSAYVLSATLGLYLGWIGRTLLCGDVPGGAGLLLMVFAVSAGIWLAARAGWQHSRRVRRILFVALYAGFWGGFVVSLGLRQFFAAANLSPILSQAPGLLICALVGGVLAARWEAPSTG